MAQTLTFDPSEGPTQEQKDAEAAALAQGEKLEQAQLEDKQAQVDQTDRETDNADLIGGKFKSQEDLLKAYQELEKQRTKDSQETKSEEASESQEEDTETTEESGEEVNPVLSKAAEEYNEGGQLSEESIEELSKMDSKDLIKAYVDFYTKTSQAADLEQTQLAEIKNIAGGEEGYTEMVQWASQNLEQSEVDAFNQVTNSGNYSAIKFAVEALNGRFKGDVGYEAPLVTGKAASDGIKPYRSQAELARDIADPRYSSDPAFRQDIENRLSKSQDLL